MLKAHTTIEVRFYELDPYNHVNHTNYLAYCEVARVRALSAHGLGLDELHALGYHIVVTDLAAKFHHPAVGGDQLDVLTEVVDVARASTRWSQRIEKASASIFDLEIRAAITDLEGVPVRLPATLRSVLEA